MIPLVVASGTVFSYLKRRVNFIPSVETDRRWSAVFSQTSETVAPSFFARPKYSVSESFQPTSLRPSDKRCLAKPFSEPFSEPLVEAAIEPASWFETGSQLVCVGKFWSWVRKLALSVSVSVSVSMFVALKVWMIEGAYKGSAAVPVQHASSRAAVKNCLFMEAMRCKTEPCMLRRFVNYFALTMPTNSADSLQSG